MTQREAILRAFCAGYELSCLNAFKTCGTMNLVQRVADYKKEGFIFITERRQTKTKFGTECGYNVYRLDFESTPDELVKPYLPEKNQPVVTRKTKTNEAQTALF